MSTPHEDDLSAQESIMRDIKIRDYDKVYFQYVTDNPHLGLFIDKRNSYKNNKHVGGGKVNKIRVSYKNNDFIIFEKKVDNGYDIAIHRNNDVEEVETCLHVMIDSITGLAYLQNISYYKNCNMKGNLNNPGGGGILLRMCIKFLKKSKEKYDIRRIQLKDNSLFTCKLNNKKIFLPIIHTLLFGDTWYGKYGFRPYIPDSDQEDKELNEYYSKNKEIVLTTKVKDTNLFNYLFEALKDESNKSEVEIKTFIDEYYAKYKNCTISQFFKMFLLNFDSTCKIFSKIYRGFYTNLKLYNFYGHPFYLDI